MKFNRHSLLAAAAANLFDDSSSTRSAADPKNGDKKPTEAPDVADGSQLPADDDKPQGDYAVDDGTGDGTSNQPDKPADDKGKAALAEFGRKAEAKGRAVMAARIETVFASDVVKGREGFAADLLAADLEPDRILAKLEKLPKGAANAMLAGLRSAGNPDLDAGAETTVDPKKATAAIWEKAHAAAGIGSK